MLLACLFLLRLPSALIPHELNVDESQMLADAMKFLTNPVPWKAVDEGSSGPLNYGFISIFLLVGFKPTFVLMHMAASFVVCLQVLVAYLTLKRISSGKAALLGAGLMVLLYGLYTHSHYLHYGTELLPNLLLMMGFYLFVTLLDGHTLQEWSCRLPALFFGGLALGMAPWGKLQAGPVMAALELLTVSLVLLGMKQLSLRQRLSDVVAYGFGSVLASCIVFVELVRFHVLDDAWYSYIQGNLTYAGRLSVAGILENVILLLLATPIHQLALVMILGVVLLDGFGPSYAVSTLVKERGWLFAGLCVYAAAALFSGCRVRYIWPKHAMFLVPPLTYIAALFLAAGIDAFLKWRRARQSYTTAVLRLIPVLLVFSATVSLYIAYFHRYSAMVRTIYGDRYVKPYRVDAPQDMRSSLRTFIGPLNWSVSDLNDRLFEVVSHIRERHEIHSMAIWGWAPGLYVLAGVPSASRYAVFATTSNESYSNHAVNLYLSDLRNHPPDLFVDAVTRGAFIWPWSEDDGFESQPGLRAFVDQNYFLAAELQLERGAKPVRYFVHRRRLDELSLVH